MYLIIGQGAAGTAAANELKRLDSAAPVTVVTNEREWYYSRIDLPDIVSAKYCPAEAVLQSAEQFADKGISCIMGAHALRIRSAERYVELANGQRLEYHKLLLATGSQPNMPKITGIHSLGVYPLWTMAHAQEITAFAASARDAVVIGAGLIGLKAALALTKRGLRVTVAEKMSRVLPEQLDETGASILEERLKAAGLEVLTGASVDAVITSKGRAVGVASGARTLPSDMVIVCAGVRPNTGLARETGAAVKDGIVTDEFLQSSLPDIYAAGDAAEVVDVIGKRPVVSAGWPAAVEQGILAARNMAAGRVAPYQGYLSMNSVEIAGMPIVSAGDISGGDGVDIVASGNGSFYKRFAFKDNVIKGFLLMGDIRQAGVLAGALSRSERVRPETVLSPAFGYGNLMAY